MVRQASGARDIDSGRSLRVRGPSIRESILSMFYRNEALPAPVTRLFKASWRDELIFAQCKGFLGIPEREQWNVLKVNLNGDAYTLTNI